mgnify:CR=1 FL=1
MQKKYICEADWVNVQKCFAGENLTERLVDGCVEEEIFYRGIIENNGTSYVWMKARKYVDVTENTAIITFHNAKSDSEYDCNNGTGAKKKRAGCL